MGKMPIGNLVILDIPLQAIRAGFKGEVGPELGCEKPKLRFNAGGTSFGQLVKKMLAPLGRMKREKIGNDGASRNDLGSRSKRPLGLETEYVGTCWKVLAGAATWMAEYLEAGQRRLVIAGKPVVAADQTEDSLIREPIKPQSGLEKLC
jgi:hypothetical protein